MSAMCENLIESLAIIVKFDTIVLTVVPFVGWSFPPSKLNEPAWKRNVLQITNAQINIAENAPIGIARPTGRKLPLKFAHVITAFADGNKTPRNWR